MPVPALFLAIAAAQAAVPPDSAIVVTGHSGPPFISPMGEPFRGHSAGDDIFAKWFVQADRNRDGVLTVDEMQADGDRFFATLDSNHDGQIDPDELVDYEWQIAPEIQVNARLRRPRGSRPLPASDGEHERGRLTRSEGDEGYDIGGGPQGAARYALLNIPEPVAAADADFNRAITLDEFRQAAVERFRLLDSNHRGSLSMADLRALLPVLPVSGTKPKYRPKQPDTRVGTPLPSGD